MKKYYQVLCSVDSWCFDDLESAITYAEQVSMSEWHLDCDVKIVEVCETTIKTFRNGGEVA